MPRPVTPERYDADTASAMTQLGDGLAGLPAYLGAATKFKVNLLAAVCGGSLGALSTVVSLTRRTAVVQVEVDNDSRPCGLPQGTVLIAEPRAAT